MKRLVIYLMLSALLTACTVGGGFNIGSGGAGVSIGTGIGF